MKYSISCKITSILTLFALPFVSASFSGENDTESEKICTLKGLDCIFPFTYDGLTYNQECAPSSSFLPDWCYIDSDKHYSYCVTCKTTTTTSTANPLNTIKTTSATTESTSTTPTTTRSTTSSTTTSTTSSIVQNGIGSLTTIFSPTKQTASKEQVVETSEKTTTVATTTAKKFTGMERKFLGDTEVIEDTYVSTANSDVTAAKTTTQPEIFSSTSTAFKFKATSPSDEKAPEEGNVRWVIVVVIVLSALVILILFAMVILYIRRLRSNGSEAKSGEEEKEIDASEGLLSQNSNGNHKAKDEAKVEEEMKPLNVTYNDKGAGDCDIINEITAMKTKEEPV